MSGTRMYCDAARALWLAALLLFISSSDLHAQVERASRVLDRELEAFIDGAMATQLKAFGVIGAGVAVVSGDEVLVRGYGHSDLARGKPVDGDRTLFRIGSIAKVFTWIGVLQLVEQGKLDLDTDVNVYLTDVQVPATFAEPVTLAHLMTHTAGFEDRVIANMGRTEDCLLPLAEIVADGMPARVRPPGELAAYSNFGATLAGHIVSEVSGMSWRDYVEQHVILPLGLEHTTPRQPVPPHLEPWLSHGYAAGGASQGFEFIPGEPAGSISASMADVARLMQAQLNLGRLGDATILTEETAALMQRRFFEHSPRLNGVLLGLYELSSHGRRVFGHGGDTIWFHARMLLVPESELGIYVAYNTDTGVAAQVEFTEVLLDRFFPQPESPAEPGRPLDPDTASRLTGWYVATRVPHTTRAKVLQLAFSIRVFVDDRGRLRTWSPDWSGRTWEMLDDLLFREVGGSERILFRAAETGQASHLFIDSGATTAFERLGPLETPVVQLGVALVTSLVLLIAAVWWPVRWLRQRGRQPRELPLARPMAWLAAVLLGAFFLAIAAAATADPYAVAFGLPALVRAAMWFPVAASVLVGGAAIAAVMSWVKGVWTLRSRLSYSVVALAGIVLTIWLRHWNLTAL